MAREMDDFDPAVEAWEKRAKMEHLRCYACAMTIPYANRIAYFRTKMCGYCAQQAEMGNLNKEKSARTQSRLAPY
jgi:hypothetical protein